MTSHERAYKSRFYPDATQEGTIESMNKNDYHTISASNDNHMKPMRAERKPQNEPVKQDTQSAELILLIITLNALIAIMAFIGFNANILVSAYLTASMIAIIGFIMHTWFQ